MQNLNLENFSVVELADISPNPWNPKESLEENSTNMEQFKYLVNEIKIRGYQDPIDVMEVKEKGGHTSYVIIDGFHRYLAVKELGYTKIIVINHGELSDDEAKQITIAREKIKIQIDEPMLAKLVNDIMVSTGKSAEELSQVLPFTPEVINDYIEMTAFDWSNYKASVEMGDEEEGEQSNVSENKDTLQNVITFVLKPNDFYIIKRVIETTDKGNFFKKLLKTIREMDTFNSEVED